MNINFFKRVILFLCTTCIIMFTTRVIVTANERWEDHPEWLWFDSFESSDAIKKKYQDVSMSGISITTADALQGERSLCQHYNIGQVDAGWIIHVSNQGFPSHLFMRWYHKFENGFIGFPPKMARMRYRPRTGDWNSQFELNCWIDKGLVVADVKALNSTQANSAGWLAKTTSKFSFNDNKNIGRWVCFEVELFLNSPGKTDGAYRIWADDSLIVELMNVDLRGSKNYLVNEVMLDGYWNAGSPKEQNRYYDNFVISTKRIGRAVASSVKIEHSNSKNSLTAKKSSRLIIDKMHCPFLSEKKYNGTDRKYLLSGALLVK